MQTQLAGGNHTSSRRADGRPDHLKPWRFGRFIVVVCVVLGFGALASAAGPNTGATVTQPAERLGTGADTRALIISDSTWLSMRNYGAFDAVQGFRNEMALARCRRRVNPSCVNTTGRPPTLIDELNARGTVTGRNTLIVQTGYNDDDTTFERDFRLIVATARKYQYTGIVWLTLRPPNNSPSTALALQNCNAILAKLVASGAFPEVTIADWATYAASQSSWLTSDQIHYTKTGAWAAADYISRKVSSLYGLPCPYPMSPGAANPPRCPDPDTMVGKPDLTALYPMSRSYFVSTNSWTGSSSWPNQPWWSS